MGIRRFWNLKDGLVKVMAICIISCVGLLAGAIISFVVASLLYVAIFGSSREQTGYECARGMAVSYLAIFQGGLLGAFLGALFTIRSYQSPKTWGNDSLGIAAPGDPPVPAVPE